MTDATKVLLISPRFAGRTFLSLEAVCEVYGGRAMTAPLGLITVAAMLPPSWDCRLVNRNTEDLTDADIDWADLVMIGGMTAASLAAPTRSTGVAVSKASMLPMKTDPWNATLGA